MCTWEDKIYILGDFNTRVGITDKGYETIIGRHDEDLRKNNGIGMLNYCQVNNLIIRNTFHQHKEIPELSQADRKIHNNYNYY